MTLQDLSVKMESQATVFNTTDFFKELKQRNFAGVVYIPEFNAHLIKQKYYPILVNEFMQSSLLTVDGSPILHKSEGRIRGLKTGNVISVMFCDATSFTRKIKCKTYLIVATVNSAGENGDKIMMIDIYGADHAEFMDHVQGHYHYYRSWYHSQ